MRADWIAAGTAAASGGTDWVARGIALGAAVIALASLAWSVISWRRQGAIVISRAIWRPGGYLNRVQLILNNRGRLDTTIETVTAEYGPSTMRIKVEIEGLFSDYHGQERLTLPASLAAQAQFACFIFTREVVRPKPALQS